MKTFNRIIQKLQHGNVVHIGRTFVWRKWSEVQKTFRRKRWANVGASISSKDDFPGVSIEQACLLWPGAADRSWVDMAKDAWPDLHASASHRSLQAAGGSFDLLGSGYVNILNDEGKIRWHDDFKSGASFPSDVLYLDVPICLPQEGTDIKVPWELSRFQHVFSFIWTDPDTYGNVFLEQWQDWMQGNRLARGVNWSCTMDVAMRAITWTAGLAAWGQSWGKQLQNDFFAALADHGHFIRDNLEWVANARTNHYFSDIAGLAVLGAVLKGYPAAKGWAKFATKELNKEILQEFAPDGFNKECSTTYHRLMVEMATLGDLACDLSGYPLSRKAKDRIVQAYKAIAVVCNEKGRLPAIGDNDSSRLFPMIQRDDREVGCLLPIGAEVYDIDELAVTDCCPEVLLLCGPDALKSYRQKQGKGKFVADKQLPDSGFYVLGDGKNQMVIRCGPTGYAPVGGHQHLDQLSFSVSLDGEEILVDPGQFCYTPWLKRRNSYRYTYAHNTVEIDQQSQCRVFTYLRTMFSIVAESKPVCETFEANDSGAKFKGYHKGYRRLDGGGDHIRTVEYVAGEKCWNFKDEFILSGSHTYEWFFHLHPEVEINQENDFCWRMTRGQQVLELHLRPQETIESSISKSHYAVSYGSELENQVLKIALTARDSLKNDWELRVLKEGN